MPARGPQTVVPVAIFSAVAVVAVVESVAVVVVMEVVHTCLRTAEKRDVNTNSYEGKLFETLCFVGAHRCPYASIRVHRNRSKNLLVQSLIVEYSNSSSISQ